MPAEVTNKRQDWVSCLHRAPLRPRRALFFRYSVSVHHLQFGKRARAAYWWYWPRFLLPAP